MQLDRICLKVDKPNAKAMVIGYRKKGRLHRTSIWLAVRNRAFPALLTTNRSPAGFKVSDIGRAMDAENFDMPLKYIADLDCEYFVKNRIALWERVCSNGLFDIWRPEEPYRRFAEAHSHSSQFRIQLLRIYEIDREFSQEDIEYASTRIDRLVSRTREVAILRPVVSDGRFSVLKKRLERSVAPYLS